MIDTHLLALPHDLPAGEYYVEVRLYRLETGERLTGIGVDGLQADHFRLPAVVVVAGE